MVVLKQTMSGFVDVPIEVLFPKDYMLGRYISYSQYSIINFFFSEQIVSRKPTDVLFTDTARVKENYTVKPHL